MGNIKLINLLIESNAEMLLLTNNGFNVLHLAVIGNKLTSFFYFSEKYKININSKDSKGNTCLHLATYFNSKKIFNCLLTNNKIDPNLQNKDGFTPLHFAVMNQNKSMVLKLLIKGANIHIKNNKFLSPLDIANKNNYQNIIDTFNNNQCRFQISKFSKIIKFLIFFISTLTPFISFFTQFGEAYSILKILYYAYIVWVLLFNFFVYRLYIIDPSLCNQKQNYLLKIIENEGRNIEEYCIKCQIIKPPGTVHCFSCDKCIKGFDHHCFWFNQCVGEKNKDYFYKFLWVILLHSLYNLMASFIFFDNNFDQNLILIVRIVNFLTMLSTFFVVCPLINFYFCQKKEKYSNNINYDEQKSNRLLNKNNLDV